MLLLFYIVLADMMVISLAPFIAADQMLELYMCAHTYSIKILESNICLWKVDYSYNS